MITQKTSDEQLYEQVINTLKAHKGGHGLYIIKPKSRKVLADICRKLNYEYKSEIAYIGKAAKTPKSDLSKRGKQEMGWSNFEGATFVRKIGLYLGFDVKDKRNKEFQRKTREYICSNFVIECVPFHNEINLLDKETEYIGTLQPCLNDKKNKTKF